MKKLRNTDSQMCWASHAKSTRSGLSILCTMPGPMIVRSGRSMCWMTPIEKDLVSKPTLVCPHLALRGCSIRLLNGEASLLRSVQTTVVRCVAASSKTGPRIAVSAYYLSSRVNQHKTPTLRDGTEPFAMSG